MILAENLLSGSFVFTGRLVLNRDGRANSSKAAVKHMARDRVRRLVVECSGFRVHRVHSQAEALDCRGTGIGAVTLRLGSSFRQGIEEPLSVIKGRC